MTMRHIYNKGIIMVVALLSLASCVKDDLYDMPGPGPDPGNDAKLVVKPGYLFASAMQVDVKPNGEQTVTMPMRQLVRLIKLNMIESGGNGEEQTIESDLTDELDDFDEEREPLLLNGELSLPVEAGAGGELSPWVTVDGGDGDAV